MRLYEGAYVFFVVLIWCFRADLCAGYMHFIVFIIILSSLILRQLFVTYFDTLNDI